MQVHQLYLGKYYRKLHYYFRIILVHLQKALLNLLTSQVFSALFNYSDSHHRFFLTSDNQNDLYNFHIKPTVLQ